MKNSAILRTAKVGGFNKDDVLTYVDELNAKIDSLKGELEKAKVSQSEMDELDNYKSKNAELTQEIEELKKKLSESEEKLEQARSNADAERSVLQNQKNAATEENNSLRNEIEALKYQLEAAQSSSDNVMTMAAATPVETIVQSADTSELENEISGLKQQLKSAKSQISEMSGEMTRLNYNITEKTKIIDRLHGENRKLVQENEDLRLSGNDSGFSGGFDMGALFAEAQATAKKIVIESKTAAEKLKREAQSEADRIVGEARVKADRINAEALGNASIMEKDAKKNVQSAVASAEKLKQMFRTESYVLDKKISDLMKNIDTLSQRFISDMEASKKEISENIDDFLNNNNDLNETTAQAKTSLESFPEKFSGGEDKSYSGKSGYNDTDVYTKPTALSEMGNLNSSAENLNESESLTDSEDYSIADSLDESDIYNAHDSYDESDSYDSADDFTEPDSYSIHESYINENQSDNYDDMPYISMSNENSDDYVPENGNGENQEYSEHTPNEENDILSAFSINPVSDDDDDDESAPMPKTNASLGFDLGDLAKLAEEAEKGL